MMHGVTGGLQLNLPDPKVLNTQDFAAAPGHPPLLPPHPALRAKARIIVDHFNTHFVPLFYRILIR